MSVAVLICLVLALWSRSASEIIVVDEALPTSNSRFGDDRISKGDMFKEALCCDCKGCNL